MSFIGFRQSLLSRVFFLVFAVICAISAILQLRFLRKLRILSVYLLPVLSFCMCYENILLYLSDNIDNDSTAANTGKVFYSMQIPLFLLIVFEVPCRLHEARSVQFFLIPFDQEKEVSKLPGELIISFMRLLAAGAFAINMFVNFSDICMEQLHDSHECSLPLRGGYYTLADNSNNIALWMALAVPSYLFLVVFNMYISLHRYGKNATLSLTSTAPWTILGIAALCQVAGQIFGTPLYAVTSNAGELVLLLGVSWIVYLVQQDLSITRSFAEFLHRSNVAFQSRPPLEPPQPRPTHPVVHHHHHHHHHHSGESLHHSSDSCSAADNISTTATVTVTHHHSHFSSSACSANHTSSLLQHLTNPNETNPNTVSKQQQPQLQQQEQQQQSVINASSNRETELVAVVTGSDHNL